MKSDEEIMEILEAFDLTSSYGDTAELAGCSPHTVVPLAGHLAWWIMRLSKTKEENR